MPQPGEAIGARIRAGRRAKDLSVNELAHRIGRSPHTLYVWEQGKALPTVLDAIALAQELALDLRYLLLGVGVGVGVENDNARGRTASVA